MQSAATTETPGEIVTTRLMNATPERLWEAWTNPALLAAWWGPKGFTNTFHLFEPRPAGTWKLTMHSQDGSSYENHWEYRELVQPERIVLRHIDAVHGFTLFATFEEREAQTLLTFRMVFDSAEECERVKIFVREANEQNLDRLEALLDSAG
jgi:uncharacterized protein YndB with AHSA1/START domain